MSEIASLTWHDVIDQPSDYMEFGACHVNCAWRRHTSTTHKFRGLQSALHTSQHSLSVLLQEVGGNPNAAAKPERGTAVYAAVWFSNASWAIVCDAFRAVVVPKQEVDQLETNSSRDDTIADFLRSLLDSASAQATSRFDETLYERITSL